MTRSSGGQGYGRGPLEAEFIKPCLSTNGFTAPWTGHRACVLRGGCCQLQAISGTPVIVPTCLEHRSHLPSPPPLVNVTTLWALSPCSYFCHREVSVLAHGCTVRRGPDHCDFLLDYPASGQGQKSQTQALRAKLVRGGRWG